MTGLCKSATGLGLALSTAIWASWAGADTRLQSKDGSFVLQGTLLETTNENYVIQTEIAKIIVRRELVNCEGDGCSDEPAEEVKEPEFVKLRSSDGSVVLVGILTDVDDANFHIETETGDFKVSRAFMSCEGEGCPSVLADSSTFSLIGPDSGGEEILSEIIRSFAAGKDYKLTEAVGPNQSNELLVGDPTGQLVATIQVSGQTTPQAIEALIDGSASFVVTRSPATPELLTELTGERITSVDEVLDETIVGLDALSVVAHPDNLVSTLSISDARRVMSGGVSNWSEVGGPDAPLNVHMIADKAELKGFVVDQLSQNGRMTQNITAHDSSEALRDAIAGDPNGIGVLYRSQVGDLQQMDLSSNCKIYYGTSDFAVQSSEYPFGITLYAYKLRGKELDETARNLMTFLTTDDGQGTLSGLGMVSQAIQIEPMRDQGARLLSSVLTSPSTRFYNDTLRRYYSAVSDGARLSTALRFVSGSSKPDTRAIQDIARISDYVRQATNQGQKLTIIGFSDSAGDFQKNLSLSAGRAEAIKQQLLERNPGWLEYDDIEVLGVGPIVPVECNDTPKGRQLNRRVEIWMSPDR